MSHYAYRCIWLALLNTIIVCKELHRNKVFRGCGSFIFCFSIYNYIEENLHPRFVCPPFWVHVLQPKPDIVVET